MAEFPLAWIVIPSWNRRDDLVACLESVQAMDYSNKQIVVVDNGSTDGTETAVSVQFPQVRLLKLAQNRGAPAASNIGFDYALQEGAELVLRLDSDAVVAPDFLSCLVSAQRTLPQAGILIGKIFYFDDPERIWSVGAYKKRLDLGAIELGRNQLDSEKYQKACQIDYAWSTGMLLTRAALEYSGGFDPDFFVYYEEPDLCNRLNQAHFEIWCVPTAKMWHKVGQASRTAWVAHQWGRSKMLFFRKHSYGAHQLILIVYAYAYAFFSSLRTQKYGGNRGPLKAALQGLTEGLRHPL